MSITAFLHKNKYQGVNNHISGSLNFTARKPMPGDFTQGEIQPTLGEAEQN